MQGPVSTLAAVGEPGILGAGPVWGNYISAAKSLLVGARVLAEQGPHCGESHTLISGFVAEALLKAVLDHAGIEERELRAKTMRHDLGELWARAAAVSPFLPTDPPDWINSLNVFHDSPYVVRYMKGINAYVLPQAAKVQSGLEDLLEVVVTKVTGAGAA